MVSSPQKGEDFMRKLRFLFPVLGLLLVLATVSALCPRSAAASFTAYYARLFARQRNVGPIVEVADRPYPALLNTAKAVLVVRAEDDLSVEAGTGYSRGDKYNERDLRRYWKPRTPRRVKVLQVVTGKNTEIGDSVWVLDTCVLTEEGLLARQVESWPMVKGCVYLLFLDGDPAAVPEDAGARPICWNNGWFDLTHLSLNDPTYLRILAAALADQDLLSEPCRQELGGLTSALAEMDTRLNNRESRFPPEGADMEWTERTLSTPWTERGYALPFRYALAEGNVYFDFLPAQAG